MASKLRVDSILPVDGAPTSGGGGVIQVVNGSTTSTTSHTSATYSDIGLSATITPKFTSSKILVFGNIGGIETSADNTLSLIHI